MWVYFAADRGRHARRARTHVSLEPAGCTRDLFGANQFVKESERTRARRARCGPIRERPAASTLIDKNGWNGGGVLSAMWLKTMRPHSVMPTVR